MRAIPAIVQHIFFAAVLSIVLQRFREEPATFVELVHLKKPSTSMETGAGYGLRSSCGVGHAVRG